MLDFFEKINKLSWECHGHTRRYKLKGIYNSYGVKYGGRGYRTEKMYTLLMWGTVGVEKKHIYLKRGTPHNIERTK